MTTGSLLGLQTYEQPLPLDLEILGYDDEAFVQFDNYWTSRSNETKLMANYKNGVKRLVLKVP